VNLLETTPKTRTVSIMDTSHLATDIEPLVSVSSHEGVAQSCWGFCSPRRSNRHRGKPTGSHEVDDCVNTSIRSTDLWPLRFQPCLFR